MQLLLRDLRSTRIGLEDVMKSAYDIKKKKLLTRQEEQTKEPVKVEKVVEPTISKAKVEDEPKISMQDIIAQMENKSKKPVQQRPNVNSQQRPQNNKNQFQKPQFDRKRDFSQDRNQGFNRNFSNGQRPFNNTNNNNQRPFQRPFGQNNQQRPFVPKNNNFASSKANTFKKFEPTESSAVLSQPERNFGNKNKSNRQIEEKKQTNKKSLLTVII